MKLRTGADCPTCHLGRSLVALAHGDLGGSRRHHPGGVWLVAVVALQVPLRLGLALARPRGDRWPVDLAVTLVGMTLVTAAVAYRWV